MSGASVRAFFLSPFLGAGLRERMPVRLSSDVYFLYGFSCELNRSRSVTDGMRGGSGPRPSSASVSTEGLLAATGGRMSRSRSISGFQSAGARAFLSGSSVRSVCFICVSRSGTLTSTGTYEEALDGPRYLALECTTVALSLVDCSLSTLAWLVATRLLISLRRAWFSPIRLRMLSYALLATTSRYVSTSRNCESISSGARSAYTTVSYV